jgi:hypothetical protein
VVTIITPDADNFSRKDGSEELCTVESNGLEAALHRPSPGIFLEGGQQPLDPQLAGVLAHLPILWPIIGL